MPSIYIKKKKKNSQKIEFLTIHIKEYNLLGELVQKVRHYLENSCLENRLGLQKTYQEYTNYR